MPNEDMAAWFRLAGADAAASALREELADEELRQLLERTLLRIDEAFNASSITRLLELAIEQLQQDVNENRKLDSTAMVLVAAGIALGSMPTAVGSIPDARALWPTRSIPSASPATRASSRAWKTST